MVNLQYMFLNLGQVSMRPLLTHAWSDITMYYGLAQGWGLRTIICIALFSLKSNISKLGHF